MKRLKVYVKTAPYSVYEEDFQPTLNAFITQFKIKNTYIKEIKQDHIYLYIMHNYKDMKYAERKIITELKNLGEPGPIVSGYHIRLDNLTLEQDILCEQLREEKVGKVITAKRIVPALEKYIKAGQPSPLRQDPSIWYSIATDLDDCCDDELGYKTRLAWDNVIIRQNGNDLGVNPLKLEKFKSLINSYYQQLKQDPLFVIAEKRYISERDIDLNFENDDYYSDGWWDNKGWSQDELQYFYAQFVNGIDTIYFAPLVPYKI